MNLDQVNQLYIHFTDMNLSIDFKDIHLLWQFYLRYKLVVEPEIQKIVEQNQEKFDQIVQRFKVNLEKNFGKSFGGKNRNTGQKYEFPIILTELLQTRKDC